MESTTINITNSGYGQQASAAMQMTHQSVNDDLVGRVFTTSNTYKLAVLLFGLVFALGIVGFAIRASGGFSEADRANWGYYAATFAFLLATFGSAPLVAVGMRFTKNHWRRPLSRASELFAIVGVLNLLWFIPLLFLFPSLENRKSIWFEVPIHRDAPIIADFAAIIALVFTGLAILYFSALPDMAAMKYHGTGKRSIFFGPLVRHWRGTPRQWDIQKAALAMLGAFYFMMLVFVHFLISSDFAMAFVPGWVDSMLPAHHALVGIQAGLAIVVVTCFLLRSVGGYKEYITLDLFWSASKLLLALGLLWGYFWFAEFNTFWYGRKPVNQEIIQLTMFDTYKLAFYLNLLGNFLIPTILLIWNPIRRSFWGPTLAAVAILIGTFFMMVRLYVPGFGIRDITAESVVELRQLHPEQLTTIWPGGADYLIIFGGISGSILIYLLATRFLPVLSVWETKEGLLYQVVRPFLKGTYMVLGKPE
jgi:hypothetical protein